MHLQLDQSCAADSSSSFVLSATVTLSNLQYRCQTLWLCREDPSYGRSGPSCSGKTTRRRRSVRPKHLYRNKGDQHLKIVLQLHMNEHTAGGHPLDGNRQCKSDRSILSPTDLPRSLRGASCHRILLGQPCCSRRGRQTAGRTGRVSACPWASAAAHSVSAPQHGYS